MKHNKHNHSTPDAAPQLVPVHFEFGHPTASTVCIAGTFNQWQPETKFLHSSGAGNWWQDLALAPGTYEYCLIVDGQWMPDPMAPETVSNPFGGRNSVLQVAISPAVAHRAAAATLPLKNDNKTKSNKL